MGSETARAPEAYLYMRAAKWLVASPPAWVLAGVAKEGEQPPQVVYDTFVQWALWAEQEEFAAEHLKAQPAGEHAHLILDGKSLGGKKRESPGPAMSEVKPEHER